MSVVVDLSSVRARKAADPDSITGLVHCLGCGHEGQHSTHKSLYFEFVVCPSCGLEKARYKYVYVVSGSHYRCHCGNDLFKLHENYIYCPNCGQEARPYE